MSGRKKKSEMEFGSDSFLDVLANIVGILIILIVIVGARLSRAPILSREQVQSRQAAAQAASEAPAAPVEVAEEAEPAEVAPAELEPDQPPQEISRELQALEAELAAITGQSADDEAALQATLSEEEQARQRLAEESGSLSIHADVLAQTKLRLAKLQRALGKKKEALTGVLAEFEQVKHEKPKVVQLKHHLTPISQSIVGEELHFRVSNNRVSVIPLKQLVERVKGQMERQSSIMARHRQHEGSVGPVDGYSLNYVIQRQMASALEEMRHHGEVRVRLIVAGWQVVPERDLEAETAEAALRAGSKFQIALMTAPPRSSLTFWVYPDSFALFRKLQSAAHAEGFIVSARPLPPGVPIAGSPHGTHSAGQ